MAVSFYEQEVKSGLKNRRKLKSFLQSLIKTRKGNLTDVDLSYIFCDDEFLLEINRQFLDHDTYTDIITFDMSDAPGVLTGEIYISTGRVKENAEKYDVSYEHELHRVIFHGALHLCGFKDKKKAEKQRMRKEEDICLNNYFE